MVLVGEHTAYWVARRHDAVVLVGEHTPTGLLWRYWCASELLRLSTALPSTAFDSTKYEKILPYYPAVLSSHVSPVNGCGIDTLSLDK